jgi:enoyl-[acyl-carrier protein] reductase II
MWRTRFVEDYRLEFPFIGAGMAFVALPPLVVAVSNAGGLGTLGVAPMTPQAFREAVRAIKSQTLRPFGVHFITQFTTEAHIEICLEERPAVVSFHWNEIATRHIERLKAGNVRVWWQVGCLKEARAAVAAGVDALIVQGCEAGGPNRSVASALALVPAVRDACGSVPVLAAGGIADGRGAAAALALGASGVVVGTRLIATFEAEAHPEYKRRLVEAETGDTAVTTLFGPEWPDQPTRCLRNRVVDIWAGREHLRPKVSSGAPIGCTLFQGQPYEMPRFSALPPTTTTAGDFEEMCLPAGQGVGLIRRIQPAAEVVREMMATAQQILHGMASVSQTAAS